MNRNYFFAPQHGLNGALETGFIQNVLCGGLPFHLDSEIERARDDTALYLGFGAIDRSVLQQLRANGNRVLLYHMGDETAALDRAGYADCDVVLRNYYFDHIVGNAADTPVYWVPNGYKTGVGPRLSSSVKPAADRNYLAGFLGWLSNSASYGDERRLFGEVAPRCGGDLLLVSTQGFSGGFNVGLYSAVVESSVYCPCPAGNSPETIRLYDALELGSIPISLKHAFLDRDAAFSAPPFPLLDAWDELPDFLAGERRAWVSERERILDRQRRCLAWWDAQKLRFRALVAGLVDAPRPDRGRPPKPVAPMEAAL